jgi:hypothetical protein
MWLFYHDEDEAKAFSTEPLSADGLLQFHFVFENVSIILFIIVIFII